MDKIVQQLAILYADVSSSTHIYETYGDIVAHENIGKCLSILSCVAKDNAGHVVKTIGDEIMCTFPNPVNAAKASIEMHKTLREASDCGDFSIGEIHIKIGWHYGSTSYRGNEIVGEAQVTAQQVVKLAKADETLTTEHSLELLPQDYKENSPLIDTVQAEAGTGVLRVRGIMWEENVDATIFGLPQDYTNNAMHKALTLEYGDKQIQIDQHNAYCRIGRDSNSDLPIYGTYTSKLHAEIYFQCGIFYLKDNSTNGTLVCLADGRSMRLHREEEILTDYGVIFFGGTPENDPQSAVKFRCE